VAVAVEEDGLAVQFGGHLPAPIEAGDGSTEGVVGSGKGRRHGTRVATDGSRRRSGAVDTGVVRTYVRTADQEVIPLKRQFSRPARTFADASLLVAFCVVAYTVPGSTLS
jgi:hypothetical protein